MTRSLPLVLLALLVCGFASPASATDLMPPHVMRQLGLTQAWARPVQAPAGAQSIADQQIFVHESNPREFVEIVVPDDSSSAEADAAKPADDEAEAANGADKAADKPAAKAKVTGKVLARIPTDRRDRLGNTIGKKEAERLASNEIRRLKRRGTEAVLSSRTVPRVRLYSLSDDGTLESRNAETGEPVWMVRVGDRRLPYASLGVSEDFVTVINGANLIKVDALNGEVIEEVSMIGAPRFGAVNSGDFVMVPLIGGGVAGYPISDPTRDPFKEIVAGSVLALPTKAPGSTKIAWGTDRGYVYVMEMQGEPSVLFRLDTAGIVDGRIASATGDRFFFGSEAGQVYALWGSRTGKVLWSKPFGEPFYDQPFVVEDQVLIRSTYGNLFSLDIETGNMTWQQVPRGVGKFIAAFDGELFVTTLSGSLAVVDLESGDIKSTFHEIKPHRLLVNTQTDRLYLVSENGDVQCLRREGDELPTFNIQPELEIEEPVEKEEKPKQQDSPFGAPGDDPFGGDGGGNDPFGGGGNDPFGGGGNDPFGGGGDGGGNDPFGGGGDGAMDDPFGDNPF